MCGGGLTDSKCFPFPLDENLGNISVSHALRAGFCCQFVEGKKENARD